MVKTFGLFLLALVGFSLLAAMDQVQAQMLYAWLRI